jgi:GT2 family glycosyltransferase
MPSRAPRVSVIVPMYDSSATIEATLRSVVAQTLDDWEVVAVDDASHDDSAQRAAAVDARVRVVAADRNGGPAAARNLGLRHARGELVALLDADDRWAPEYLQEMVAAYDRASAEEPVGLVCCDARLEGPDGPLPGTYRERIGAPEHVDVETLLRGNVVFVSALAPRAAVLEVGGFDERTFGSEDHDLWLKLAERGLRIVVVPKALATYRVTAGSVSSSAARMARTAQATYRLALARGRLTPRQRRIARRQVRVHQAVELLETRGPRSPRALAAAAVAFGAEALSRPRDWPGWARAVARGRVTPWRGLR